MRRIHFLAAEFFNYSYDNYEDHLGIGNARFDTLMPNETRLYERAEKEGWDDERLAKESDSKLDEIPDRRKKFREARDIVDAESPAKLFLRAARASIKFAVKEGLEDEQSIENLVGQMCYRAADLSCVLKHKDDALSEYSRELRKSADDIQKIEHNFNFED